MAAGNDKKIYYQKRVNFFALLEKIKLWPSRRGFLHGIREITFSGNRARISTHCGEIFYTYDSRNGRAARWMRNKWIVAPCPRCRVPDWKLQKYSATFFKRRWGSRLHAVAVKLDQRRPVK